LSKILIHPSDAEGCGFYRILQPAKALYESHPLHIINSFVYASPQQIIENDIKHVIVQRHSEPKMVERLAEYKSLGLTLVHDLDDLLWQVPPTNPYHRYFKGENKKALHSALQMVDHVSVSTQPLAVEVRKFTRQPSIILPNYVSRSHYQPPKERQQEKLRVGWAGSPTHVGDLGLIRTLVTSTLNEYQWVFMGYCPEEWKSQIEFHNYVDIKCYMDKLKELNLDAVVIPLENNLFNEAKSYIKLLEFASIGVPCITTDIYPYKDNPNPIFPNNNKAWRKYNQVLDSWKDEQERMKAATLAYNWAQKYILENNTDKIRKAWHV
jgi:O-antigen biosynthesis protein